MWQFTKDMDLRPETYWHWSRVNCIPIELKEEPELRIAILSDIHGNMDALGSIDDSFDELWVLGDFVNYGPEPGAVVDWVRRNATLVVRGNHDNAIGSGESARCSAAFVEMPDAMQAYTEAILSGEQLAYLRSLPTTARRAVDGREFFLCHASPCDPLFAYLPPEAECWRREVEGLNADVVLTGHTHVPYGLRVAGRRVVNPGSVGQPKQGAPEACYAIWDSGSVVLKRRPYPVDEAARKVRALPIAA